MNQPPMPTDFSQVLREEREREWEQGKSKRTSAADQFWSDAPEGFFKNFNKDFK